MTIQAVLFDCDGVLLDTERLANEINVGLLCEAGIEISLEECEEHMNGRTGDQVRAWITEKYGYLPENMTVESGNWASRFCAAFSESDLVIPGVRKLLESLTLPSAVVSNSSLKDLGFKFHETGLNCFFPAERCFSGYDLNMPKPEPGAYLAAAEYLGVPAEDCLVVEDSEPGVRAGKAAGMTVYGFSAGSTGESLRRAGADWCFRDMKELEIRLQTIS